MNKLVAILLIVSVIFPLVAGCTMTMDPQDHGRYIARSASLESRQMVEDFDTLWLIDDTSHLTSWYMPFRAR